MANPVKFPSREEIADAELFADWQVSCTEILLLEMLISLVGEPTPENLDRIQTNEKIKNACEAIMKNRFSVSEIRDFLENGYPRRHSLQSIFSGKRI